MNAPTAPATSPAQPPAPTLAQDRMRAYSQSADWRRTMAPKVSPWVERALARRLPAKELAR